MKKLVNYVLSFLMMISLIVPFIPEKVYALSSSFTFAYIDATDLSVRSCASENTSVCPRLRDGEGDTIWLNRPRAVEVLGYDSDWARIKFSYWGYEYVYSYADYKRKVNQFVFPIILNWNAARNDNWSFYLGIGYEFGVLLSDNYKFEYDFGDPFNESYFYRYGDEDFVQLSVPSRSVILQMGFAGRHWDWKAYYKIHTKTTSTFNSESGAVGTAFTYYF